ncbi:methyltransferase HemK [Legionella busanensis]|uniref:Release factor glutamine methyltransferase n=1 Tax=Legionella busanensis TaxID=190655 RepID=A0A378JL97_9GAMM|nr:peptide chain release factor N(5)-glutamine methyltransferase [Legionella busanensis]STX52005.1 methyltransferase HemK [Legionella busanensis]
MNNNIKYSLELAIRQLAEYIPDDARTDAEILLAHAMGKTRTYIYTHPEAELTKEEFKLFQRFVARRSLGVPVAYIIGTREFWSLPLKVNEETLIPRPETELLVEIALNLLKNCPKARILDLGTGSGAIALALAKEKSDWEITACDCSEGALITAKKNAHHLNLSNIHFCYSDWFSQIEETKKFHAIVSNPPYVAANDPHLISGDLRFEPQLALIGGSNGLAALEHIIKHSIARLEPNGLLLIEHGFDQKSAVASMLNNYGYQDIKCWQDLQGHDRVSVGKYIIS